jgi:Archaeal fructose-1,6-bisphosphatase and related enzymes of inositol monophosphatase family
MRKNLKAAKKVNAKTSHDIKLELDVRCQKLIEKTLHKAFPEIAFLGEEGNSGAENAEYRWVVDPIDGTVNFSYGIPHACVCIALQKRISGSESRVSRSKRNQSETSNTEYETILGLIYDPFLDEMFTATATDAPRLNGKPIRVSDRSKLEDSICVMGYGKNENMIRESLPLFGRLTIKCRKLRNMGSAGLGLAYVACGRFDAYIERGVSLWDIAAGGFIVERAGGEFWRVPTRDKYGFRMITTNGKLRKKIEALM